MDSRKVHSQREDDREESSGFREIKIKGMLGRFSSDTATPTQSEQTRMAPGHPPVFPVTFLFVKLTISVLIVRVVLVIQLRGKKLDVLSKGHSYALAQCS